MQGLIGKKMGMTQVFGEDGVMVPVTVIEVGPCPIVQRKTKAHDGYESVQVAFGKQKPHRVSKPLGGRFKKAGVETHQALKEFPVPANFAGNIGDVLTVASLFDKVVYVDVTAYTKGRGFAGVVRRHKMSGGPMTHGGHSKRRIGAIGQRTWPARVGKGHRMPGQMGNVKCTTQNLRVVSLRPQDNLMLVRGAVPGPVGGIVWVRKALKKTEKAG